MCNFFSFPHCRKNFLRRTDSARRKVFQPFFQFAFEFCLTEIGMMQQTCRLYINFPVQRKQFFKSTPSDSSRVLSAVRCHTYAP